MIQDRSTGFMQTSFLNLFWFMIQTPLTTNPNDTNNKKKRQSDKTTIEYGKCLKT